MQRARAKSDIEMLLELGADVNIENPQVHDVLGDGHIGQGGEPIIRACDGHDVLKAEWEETLKPTRTSSRGAKAPRR